MSGQENLSIAVPWCLSHYIPSNGFHPLYRALFDHAPVGIGLNAWDNVKLHNRFGRDIEIRDAILGQAKATKRKSLQLDTDPIASAYWEFFWPPNQVLTRELAGDIEFHHTAPFPSLERPFVFHCEAFAPVFMPFANQGSGDFKNHEELRKHYYRIFSNPLCLGIFSHIPETLESFRVFFSDTDIDRKLFSSRIGLSSYAIVNPVFREKPPLSKPRFLFVNSANQNPANFFRRGGHIVLRFWREYLTSGGTGLLMLRCAKPSEKDLIEYGVDPTFLNAEASRTILWAEDYLANHEMNALMESAHFFLLPSASLHSVSLMQAMTLGTIPIVTDTLGVSSYINDNETGIILHGVRAAIWHTDPNTGVLVDQYRTASSFDDSLVKQLTYRIRALLKLPDAYQKMRSRAMEHASQHFSGEIFSTDFWSAVSDLYRRHKYSLTVHKSASNTLANSLSDCTLRGEDWTRVFESTTQPLRRVYTGQSVVWELGGAVLHAYGNPHMELSDWSVMSPYYSPGSPQITFANTFDELGGKYLLFAGTKGKKVSRKITDFVSRILMPFPGTHSYAASALKKLRRYRRRFLAKFGKSLQGPETELVLHVVAGYNVIRHSHIYYAIPQSEGAFVLDKIHSGGYTSSFIGNSVDQLLCKIALSGGQAARPHSDHLDSEQPELILEGFRGFNVVRFANKFYAILQSEGVFEWMKVLSKEYSRSFSGDSLAEVQSAIMAGITTDRPPPLLKSPPSHIKD